MKLVQNTLGGGNRQADSTRADSCQVDMQANDAAAATATSTVLLHHLKQGIHTLVKNSTLVCWHQLIPWDSKDYLSAQPIGQKICASRDWHSSWATSNDNDTCQA